MKTRLNLLTIAFLFIANSCFGQSEKFNLGFEVYTNLADRYGDNEVLKDIESPRLAASFGAVVSYRANPKVALISGLSMLNKGWKDNTALNFNELRWGSQSDDEGGFDPGIFSGEVINSVTVKHNYYFLSIPLNVRYGFGESLDKGWYVQGGVSPVFYLFNRSRVIQETDTGTRDETYKEVIDDARKVNLNLNLGMGYTFLLKEKFQISVGPSLEYMPFSVVKDARWKNNFYAYGVGARFMVL